MNDLLIIILSLIGTTGFFWGLFKSPKIIKSWAGKEITSASDFEYILKEGVEEIKIDNYKFFARIPSQIDVSIYQSILAEGVSQDQKRINFLCALLCDKKGIRIFDEKNKDHKKTVLSLPDKVQNYLIVRCQEIFFPKKKSKIRTWSFFSFMRRKPASQSGSC